MSPPAAGIFDRCLAVFRWLVLPVSALLFLQWPLRAWVHAWSQQANDLAQWLFALFVAASVTVATRAGAHLATEAGTYRPLRRIGGAICVLPWALFIVLSLAPTVWRSVAQWEAFPETADPGYWIVKVAAWLLALLVGIQALADIVRPR